MEQKLAKKARFTCVVGAFDTSCHLTNGSSDHVHFAYWSASLTRAGKLQRKEIGSVGDMIEVESLSRRKTIYALKTAA